METLTKNLYEAMFLIDSAQAASDWDGIIKYIRNILERAEAEIITLRKWDERKLAYNIQGKNRGTYIVCYFRASGDRVSEIERNVRLSERIMRLLVLRADHLTTEDFEKVTPAELAEKNTPQTEYKQQAETGDKNPQQNSEQVQE